MGECRQLPANTVESYETLPEMYLGLGVRRDASTNASLNADRSVQTNGIDLALLRDRDAVACLDQLIRSNPSLAAYSSRTQQLIQHFRHTDPRDPDHITWAEIRRDYGQDAEDVAYSINAYLGLLHYVGQGATPPPPPVTGMTPDLLTGYGTLTQAYIGIGIDRDAATGIARAPLPRMPQGGLDLSILNDPSAIASLEAAARGNPNLVADLHRVRQILEGLRQADPQNPDSLTQDKIRGLYGQDAGNVLVSINAYLALLNRASGRASVVPGGGSETGFNPWLRGGLMAVGVVLGGMSVYLLRRPRVTPPAADPSPLVARPPAAIPPPPPERFVRADGGEVIVFPDRSDGRWSLGRGYAMEGFVPLVQDPTDPAYQKISRQHAEITREADGSFSLRDLRSINGTRIYREDPVAQVCSEIRLQPGQSVPLREGDVIGFGLAEYRFRVMPGGPILDRMSRIGDAAPAPAAPQSIIEPLRIATPEEPLIGRLRSAMGGDEVELFMREPNGTMKEKYVGRIMSVTGEGDAARVQVRFGNNTTRTFRLDQILTARGRSASDDLSSRYIHPRLTNPQFHDKSVNLSNTDGSGMGVLVDYSDPRLTTFLDEYIRPIRERLDRGEISQRQAADMVWRVVHDYVPYDRPRGVYHVKHLPNRLYRLGDFIETGVCNERGMLVQVANQYVGVTSQLEKGPFMGGRHAWVRSFFPDGQGGQIAVIHDPQHDQPYEVGRDAFAQIYRNDSTPFAKSKVMTVLLDDDAALAIAQARREASSPSAAQPVNVNTHAPVTEANIAMEIKSRYPALRNSRNDRTVQEIAREVFREWQRTGSRIDTSQTAVVGLPSARIVDTVTSRYFEELTRRDASGAAALRRGGRDRSDLSERDRDSLGREILEAVRRAPERAVESAP